MRRSDRALFRQNGTTVGSTDPVYLPLFAGLGQSLSSLSICDYSGASWVNLSPSDLAYGDTCASFTDLKTERRRRSEGNARLSLRPSFSWRLALWDRHY